MIVVVGSINADLFINLPRWPARGETIAASAVSESLGGKGANQAVAAARLGAPVRFVGAVGDDQRAAPLTEQLAGEGIDLHLARKDDAGTGLAVIDIGPDGDNIIRILGGANQALTADDIPASVFTGAKAVLLQNEIPLAASLAAATMGRAAGATVIMDPAPAPAKPWPTDVLAGFDLLTPNATEAAQLTGLNVATAEEGLAAARQLANRSGRGALITLGPLGAVWSMPEGGEGTAPAPNVKAIDTVAAGDCFNAALAVALSDGDALTEAAAFACKAAAFATTRKGSAASLPTRADLSAL